MLWINMSWDENVKKYVKSCFILHKVSQILSAMLRSHNQLNTNFFSVIIQNYSEWISSYSKSYYGPTIDILFTIVTNCSETLSKRSFYWDNSGLFNDL